MAKELATLVAKAGSVRRAAGALELIPTTLSRSLESGAFASATRAKIRSKLPAAHEALDRPPSRRQKTNGSINEMLHLLHKLNKLLPDALAELEGAVTSVESKRESDTRA